MPAKPAATCVSNTFVTSVASTRRASAMSWRPACTTTCTAGSASSAASGDAVEALGQRVQHLDAFGPALAERHGELDQAQQRAVAALAHELRVEGDPARRARVLGERLGQSLRAVRAHRGAPGSSHSTLPRSRPAWRETSVPLARIHRAGAEQAGLPGER